MSVVSSSFSPFHCPKKYSYKGDNLHNVQESKQTKLCIVMALSLKLHNT